jgi:ABC-type dipeptide/oligopeptide/nickel transport system permease subunit
MDRGIIQRLWSGPSREISGFAKKKPLGAIGGVIVALTVLAAIFAPVIAPSDPYKVHPDRIFASPSASALVGTDQVGRDVFSRLIYGARISLFVGIVSVGIGATVGAVVGVVSAYFGRYTDLVIQRVLDALIAFPGIVLALGIMAALGKASLINVILALTIVFAPGAARTIRSRALTLQEMDFVLAARAVGASDWRIIFRHIIPNCVSLYIVFFSITVGFAIVVEASLSFLGVGTPPEVPSWGGMLSLAATNYIGIAPLLAILPGVAIALVVFGFNLLGDGLRDVLDPRLRGT